MIILDVNKVSKNFGYAQLFKELTFSLNEGECISVVGPNGCGKSTLLKLIAQLEKIDSGTISIKKGATVSYLDQTAPDFSDERLVIDVLNDAFSDLRKIEKKIKSLQEELEQKINTKEYEKILNSYFSLIEQFSNLGGYEIETNINTVCSALNISKEMLSQTYSTLSGGEKTLVHLAKTLLLKPDLLLLDEPTNHLDINKIEWLENYVKSFKGAIVVVSHDRYFLDKISNKILEIDNGQAKIYNTNYSGYVKEKETDLERLLASYKDQQILIKKLEEQIKYFSQRGMATNSSTLCDRAKALQTRLDKIKENLIIRPKERKDLNLGFVEERKNSKVIIETKDLTVKLDNGKEIIKNINITIKSKEKIAIIGDNGSGKSTFIKSVLGVQDLEVLGSITVGPSVKIGYLPQTINFKNDNENVLEYLKNELSVDEQKARFILAGFQFYKEDVNKKLKNLSGGERIRLRLAILLQNQINTLIFDEPTNHIDIPTKELLEKSLEEFNGTLIFVSHDRFFINKFAEKIIEFKNGSIATYIGNYNDYKEKINK